MPFVFQRDMNNIQFLMLLCQVGWRCHIPIAICLILRNILTRRVAPAKEATTSGFILGTKVKGTPQHATTQINLTRRNKRYLLRCTELSALTVSIGIYILHRNREIIFRKLFQLIDTYSERNKEIMDYHYHSSTQEIGTEYILKDVEYDQKNGEKETTYDGLIQEYVNLNIGIRQVTIEKEHKEYLLSVFNAAAGRTNSGLTPEEIRGKIAHCVDLATEYYRYVENTGHELNRYLSANYLTTVSSINVEPTVNLKLYLLIAAVLFLVLGGIVAVLLGRTLDFIDYFRYIDKTVQLPNRAKCDEYINTCAGKLLDENFSCMALRMDSLGSLSSAYGRETGDAVLKDFAMILKSFGGSNGFVGYNGSGVFLAFFPDCSAQKTGVIAEAIERQVGKYNTANPDRSIDFTCAAAGSSADGVFEIRQLLRLALQRLNGKKTEPAQEPAKATSTETDGDKQ